MDPKAAPPRPSRRRCSLLIVCAIAAAVAATAVLAVALTVYRVRDPVMTMNAFTVEDFDVASVLSSPELKLAVVADVSVKNPNAATLRYGPSRTSVYYRERQVGAARAPPGTAMAHRTVRLNMTVEIAVAALLGDPAFFGELAAGAVVVSTATRVHGRVAVLGVVRRRVELVMNCTVAVDVGDMSIRNQSCWQRVWL